MHAVCDNRSVPWCASCQRFLSPPTVTPEGRCPTCGRPVEPGRAHPAGPAEQASRADDGQAGEEELGPIPLHLKILGVALVVYLGYRFVQGVEWIIHRF
jgi:predicted RNA-binding Zn-ribbon protein involved in translation (DUF1610 family)